MDRAETTDKAGVLSFFDLLDHTLKQIQNFIRAAIYVLCFSWPFFVINLSYFDE